MEKPTNESCTSRDNAFLTKQRCLKGRKWEKSNRFLET